MIVDECNTASDDGMCCAAITIETRAFREANGLRSFGPFTLTFDRENGTAFCDLPIRSVERVVDLVQGLNPELVHVGATDDERDALMAEIRAHVAGAFVAQITAPASAVDVLH